MTTILVHEVSYGALVYHDLGLPHSSNECVPLNGFALVVAYWRYVMAKSSARFALSSQGCFKLDEQGLVLSVDIPP